MPDNPNYVQTPKGWVKKDSSVTKGAPIDWERLEQMRRWQEQLRRERAERNKVKPK